MTYCPLGLSSIEREDFIPWAYTDPDSSGLPLLAMDVVVTSSMGAAETQHLQFDSLHMNPEPAAQRRQMRYTSPDMSAPHSPRRTADNSSAVVRASPSGDEGYAAMHHISPSISPFSADQVARDTESTNADILLEVDGQNHDRMETDMETDDSELDHQSHHGLESSGGPLVVAAQEIDGEIMDTTPDSPPAAEPDHQLDVGMSHLHWWLVEKFTLTLKTQDYRRKRPISYCHRRPRRMTNLYICPPIRVTLVSAVMVTQM